MASLAATCSRPSYLRQPHRSTRQLLSTLSCFRGTQQPKAVVAGAAAAPAAGLTVDLASYPPIDMQFPGLDLVHPEPPVFVCHGLLTDAECEAIIAAASANQLPEIEYDNSMLLDTQRLWPLALVAMAGAGFDSWQHNLALDGTPGLGEVAVAVSASFAKWGAIIGAMVAGVQALMPAVVGKVFTGTKWAARGLTASGGRSAQTAEAALCRFVEQVSSLSLAHPSRFEVPTVTRYQKGQYQRAHYDGRPAGDPDGLKEFMQAGGQRLMQVVVYLNTLTPEQQGGTHFHKLLMGGLTVQPRRGTAVMFFPAFADGTLDHRMLHSGLAVRGGEKWICNTWVCQSALPTGCSAQAALGQVTTAKQGH